MNIQRQLRAGAPAGVQTCDTLQDLKTFLEPSCAAALWQREIPIETENWLDGLDPEVLPRGRVTLPSNAVKGAVGHLLDIAQTPQGNSRDWLQQDITELAMRLASLLSNKFLRLRLDVVTTNACRKFHIDAIRARLVCTYRGTGTQYGIADNEGSPSQIYTTPTGAPILLRGRLWPASPEPGLLHRSPPIEGTGETRLVLVLDPVHKTEEQDDALISMNPDWPH